MWLCLCELQFADTQARIQLNLVHSLSQNLPFLQEVSSWRLIEQKQDLGIRHTQSHWVNILINSFKEQDYNEHVSSQSFPSLPFSIPFPLIWKMLSFCCWMYVTAAPQQGLILDHPTGLTWNSFQWQWKEKAFLIQDMFT